MKLKFLILILILCVTENNFSQTEVKINSLGPSGGIITAIDGTESESVLIAGVKNNGIYFSTNSGANWTQSNLKNTTVNQFAINSLNSSTFYAATENGIYVSTDAGRSWNITSITQNASSIFYHAKSNSIVAGVYLKNSQASGTWHSKNNGQAWTKIDTSIKSSNLVTAIAMDQNDDSTVFIGIDSLGLFASYDLGRSWTQEIRGLQNEKVTSKRIQTILHYYDPLVLYNVIGIGTANGIFISNNFSGSPMSWTSLRDISGISDNIISASKINLISTLNRYYFFSTKQNLGNEFPGEIKGGLYRVNTLNQSMSLVFKNNIDVNSIFIPKQKNNKVYIATSNGIYVSAESGINFKSSNVGLNHAITKNISVTNETNPIYFISVYGGGVQRSLDSGSTWEFANVGLSNPYVYSVQVDTQNLGVVYAATVRGIYRSNNFGDKWSFISIPILDSTKYNSGNFGTLRIGSKKSSNILFSSFAHGLNLSSNYGQNWTKPNSQNIPQFLNYNTTENFELIGKNDSTILGVANGVWKSFDFGQNWVNYTNNYPLNIIDGGISKKLFAFRPHINPKNDSVIFISTTTDLVNLTPYKLFRTTNNALIWNELTIKAKDISIDNRKPKVIFALGEKNIYHTLDGGDNWNLLSQIKDSTKFNYLKTLPINPNVQLISSSNGVHKIEFSSEADLSFTEFIVDMGGQTIGSTYNRQVFLNNIGGVELNIFVDSVKGSDKIILIEKSLKIASHKVGILNLKYSPVTIGENKLTIYLSSNDPKYEKFEIQVIGIGVGKTNSKQKILIDSLHGFNSANGVVETKKYFSKLISVLSASGFEVVTNQKNFSTFGFHAIVLPPPTKLYSEAEIDSIQKYILRGGFVVMLADSGAKIGNKFLNDILTEVRWKLDYKDSTDLLISANILIDSVKGLNPIPTIINVGGVMKKNHNYFLKVDTLVVSGAVEILSIDSTKKYFVGNPSTRIISNNIVSKDSIYPSIISEVRIKSGRILVIGDCDIFSNGNIDSVNEIKKYGLYAKNNLQFAINIFTFKNDVPVQLPKKTPNENYIAFTIPFNLSNFQITTVLKDLGSIDPSRWRLFKWSVKTGKYIEFPNLDFIYFNRGDGYWLITKGEKTVNFGVAQQTSETDFYPIMLQPGYNLVGNPFPYKVSWKNSIRSENIEKKIWSWSGTKFISDTNYMDPFAAYYIKNNSQSQESIQINPLNLDFVAPKINFQTNNLNQNEWKVKIKASSQFALDEENFIGILNGAKKNWDTFETSEPPTSPSNYLSIYFNREDWNKNNPKYSTDFRNVSNENDFWDFQFLSSRSNENFVLNFETIGSLNKELFLIDFETERIIDLTNNNFEYNFKTKKGELNRSFRIVVGNKNYAEQNSNGIPFVPLEYNLSQNFPNPFNSSTKINYTLSHSGNVKVKIFNILGQIIRNIDDGFHPIGNYSITWNGLDENKIVANTGIYFYKIEVNDFVTQKKMLLIK